MNFTTKTLLYVVGFIATCFLGFYIIGLVKPTVSYESKIIVNRSAKQTWAVFSNKDLMNQWMPGFVKIENIKGEALQKGSEFKLFVKENGQDFEMLEKVIEVIPAQYYEFELENGILRNHVKVKFVETQAFTTEITQTSEVHAQNWFFRSLFVFFKSQFKEQDEKTLQALKKLVEMDVNELAN
jgi:uncharacterized protein YndB with AHSA1/START domain